MADRDFERANAGALERLEALVASLAPEQLGVDVGDGWTVSMVLAHLAFWDRWQVERWRDARARGLDAPSDMPDVSWLVNLANEAVLGAIPADAAGALAVAAAHEVNELVTGLPDGSIRAVVDGGRGRLVDRSLHRFEHLDQIDRALASR